MLDEHKPIAILVCGQAIEDDDDADVVADRFDSLEELAWPSIEGAMVVYDHSEQGIHTWIDHLRRAALISVLEGRGNLDCGEPKLEISFHGRWATRSLGSGATIHELHEDDGDDKTTVVACLVIKRLKLDQYGRTA